MFKICKEKYISLDSQVRFQSKFLKENKGLMLFYKVCSWKFIISKVLNSKANIYSNLLP